MIRFVLLGAGITLLILGVGYLLVMLNKIRNNHTITPSQKKSLLAALGAALLGFLLIYRNYKSRN
jgi:hypothetical protein